MGRVENLLSKTNLNITKLILINWVKGDSLVIYIRKNLETSPPNKRENPIDLHLYLALSSSFNGLAFVVVFF